MRSMLYCCGWRDGKEGRKQGQASCLAMPKKKALLDQAGMGLIHD